MAALTLCGIVALLHGDVLVRHKSLVQTNYWNALDPRFLPENYGPNATPVEEWSKRGLSRYANLQDPGATWWQWEPSTHFLMASLRRREWPLWDPYVAAGTPAMANLIPAYFFPPYFLTVLGGGSIALRNVYFLVLLWAAGWFTYLLLRRHDLTPAASVCGGALVIVSGGLNQNLGSFMGQTVCCLPFVLYISRLFIDGPSPRTTAALAVTYASAALASFPPLLVAVFGITALYSVVTIAVESPTFPLGLRRLAAWAVGVVLGLGLVGFYYGPALALKALVPQVAAFYQFGATEIVPSRTILQLLSPTVLGGVQVYASGPFAAQSWLHLPYVGCVTLLAALLSAPTAGSRSLSLWWAISAAAAVVLLKLLGVPPVQWIALVRPFNEIHMARYLGVPLSCLLAILAALGIDAVVRGQVGLMKVLAAVAIVGAGVERLGHLTPLVGVLDAPAMGPIFRDWQFLVVTTFVASLGLVVVAARRERGWRALGLTALGLAGLSEAVFNNHYPKPAQWDVFAHPPQYVQTLLRETHGDRVLAIGEFAANLNEAFEIPVVDSLMAFNPPRIYELYHRYSRGSAEAFMRLASQMPPELVLDRANIGLISASRSVPFSITESVARKYEPLFDDGLFAVYRRPTLPRFFFSSQYTILSREQALEAIAERPALEVLLEESPGFQPAANEPADPRVQVKAMGRNGMVLSINAPRPGLVYASDSFFEGWRATVNGTDVPILPANYAFRAVPVPAGYSEVEFRYWPAGLTAGLIATGISLAVIIGLVLIPSPRPEPRGGFATGRNQPAG